MIGPYDVGHRVVVRRLAGVHDGRQMYSDVLGTLLDFGTAATVQTTRGPVVVPVAEIATAKRVPPRATPSGADIAALEWIATAAWPAPRTARLGDWLLRAAGGWTGRANSVLPLGDPGRPLDAALDEIVAWYAADGLTARINVPLPLRIDLDRALDERGWQRSPRTLMQARDLAGLATLAGPHAPDLARPDPHASDLARPEPGSPDPSRADPDRPGVDGGAAQGDTGTGEAYAGLRVTLDPAPGAAWLAMMAGMKGALPAVAEDILTGPDEVRFVSVTDPAGALLAIGRGAVNDGHLHLGLVQVVPAARRRGLAQLVVAALASWAAGLAAHRTYLQVEEANSPATALYGRLGFTTHHSYFTWTAPPQ